MPALPRLHVVSAAACVFISICGGGAGRVGARGRMLHVDNRLLGGQLRVLFTL